MSEIDRRGFLTWVGLYAATGAAAAVYGVTPRRPYSPVGYMDPFSPGAIDIDYVTLDGRRIERVFELDDVEGWAKWYGLNPEVEGDRMRSYHGTGEVRIHWKKSKHLPPRER